MEPKLREAYERIYARELEARAQIFAEFPAFLVNGIRDRGDNRVPVTVIRQWLREKKIFAFPYRGHYWLPAFQFGAGEPKPVVKDVLRLIQPSNGWQTMYWFASANGWLEAGTPAELIDVDPAAVVEAASYANDMISD